MENEYALRIISEKRIHRCMKRPKLYSLQEDCQLSVQKKHEYISKETWIYKICSKRILFAKRLPTESYIPQHTHNNLHQEHNILQPKHIQFQPKHTILQQTCCEHFWSMHVGVQTPSWMRPTHLCHMWVCLTCKSLCHVRVFVSHVTHLCHMWVFVSHVTHLCHIWVFVSHVTHLCHIWVFVSHVTHLCHIWHICVTFVSHVSLCVTCKKTHQRAANKLENIFIQTKWPKFIQTKWPKQLQV